MKQTIIIFLLFFLNSYSQNFVQYKFDENSFSIDIPEGYEEVDLSGQHFVRSFIGENIILMSKSLQKNTVEITNESSLIEYYEGVREGILESSNGESLEDEIVEIQGVKFLKLKYKVLIADQPKVFDSLIVTLNEYTYSLMFIYSEGENKDFMEKKRKIMSSLKLN